MENVKVVAEYPYPGRIALLAAIKMRMTH